MYEFARICRVSRIIDTQGVIAITAVGREAHRPIDVLRRPATPAARR